jgi:hypothetical protein
MLSKMVEKNIKKIENLRDQTTGIEKPNVIYNASIFFSFKK